MTGPERGPAPAPSGTPRSVGIVGLGLMGGSLARRLRTLDHPPEVWGVDADPVRGTRALEEGIITRFGLPGDGAPGEAELVVLASPLGAAVGFLRRDAASLPADTLLTDLVSLNGPILRAASAGNVAHRTVTAHPMCGSERSDPAAQRADLFEGARVWLSAGPEAPEEVRRRVGGFWRDVGGLPEWIESGEHDRMMAWVSHLPQLVANALAGALDAQGFRPSDLGPGGRGMVRLAGSSPYLWKDLLEHSAPVAGAALTSVSRGLNAVADLLARREMDRIEEFMDLTRRWATEETAPGDDRLPGERMQEPGT